MLFNSNLFLFAFLPVSLLGYQVVGMFHRRAVIAWLGFMSLVFYAWWHPPFLLILLGSIAFNYGMAALISGTVRSRMSTFALLWVAIVGNLAALGYYKYLVTLLNFMGTALHAAHHWENIALPLGISFFTFTQIAYLVDLQQGVATMQDPLSYVLFVTFFPHLIAGPILHHKEMMPQFQQERRYQLRLEDVSVGFSWFLLGLAKKTLLADTFAVYADTGFAHAGHLSAGVAWVTSLAYALQLYFDFSGYSDMALGLARMFSIDFPLNFNSPYKATSIIDFWSRWHMTLSLYIMDYLYSPLQFKLRAWRREHGLPVNRAAMSTAGGFATLIALPTLFSMGIVGIWHGAGVVYLVYGLLHGFYLVANHAWRVFGPKVAVPEGWMRSVTTVGCIALTFFCVVISFIFFRAGSIPVALQIIGNMFGHHQADVIATGDRELRGRALRLAGGFAIVWFLPNTQQILRNFKPSLRWDEVMQERSAAWPIWAPTVGWAVVLSVLFVASLSSMQNPSAFLYFHF